MLNGTESMLHRTFSENLEKLLMAYGIQKKDLAKELGIPPYTLSTWLNGTPVNIAKLKESPIKMKRLAKK